METTEKNAILIADDAELNREMIKYIFEEQYRIYQAVDGEQAIDILKKESDSICLLFLDLMMPRKSGLDVLRFMNDEQYIDKIPVIMITGEATDETDEKAYEYGAADIIYKPFAPNVVMRRAQNLIELFEHRSYVERMLEKRTGQLRESREKLARSNAFLVNALSSVIEVRSFESVEHIQRIKYFTEILLKYLMRYYPQYGITPEQAALITDAAALHDLGKIAIPDSILQKAGSLTEEETEEFRKHTLYGCQILERSRQEDNELYSFCYDICRYHHERYDGKGYPDGLKGDAIPIWAQIVSVADVYDMLISKSIYKDPFAAEGTASAIIDEEYRAFSPEIADCFKLAENELFAAAKGDDILSFADLERTEQ